MKTWLTYLVWISAFCALATPAPSADGRRPHGHPAVLSPLPDTQTVGESSPDELTIADEGRIRAVVVVAANAGLQEQRAATDLVNYIELMSGARPAFATDDRAIADALAQTDRPVLIVGSLALDAAPGLRQRLEDAAKKSPTLRADSIVIRREENRVYIAGNNDEAHYYSVAALLHAWGCRWFMPGDFGESIPSHPSLKIGKIDYAYGSPFEVRGYWVSWNGEKADRKLFSLRNMMNDVRISGGHSLGRYTKSLGPGGGDRLSIPIAEDATADAIANHPDVQRMYSEGKDFSLGMEDGVYRLISKADVELQADIFDKYFLAPSLTDNFMQLYNAVCEKLMKQYPESRSKIGFLAYANITIPPQRDISAAAPLVMSLAPIDIDPNHAMNDTRSPSKQEYRSMMLKWRKVMDGRMFVYDYDQGMLVWRDLPAPIAPWIEDDIREYARADILGVHTESRHAIATVFVNLYLRGRLLWNPNERTEDLLSDFYQRFFGPVAEPMARYWEAINRAWAETIVTEHEFQLIPAVYTPALVSELRALLEEAEALMQKVGADRHDLPRDWQKYQERMKFMRLSFDLIEDYTAGARAAATDADYAEAAELLDRALKTRLAIGNMNKNFTTRVIPSMPLPETAAAGPMTMPGEAAQYRVLAELTDGTRGTLLAKFSVEWSFHRDPHDTGLVSGYADAPIDLSYWFKHKDIGSSWDRKDYPTTEWEMVRTDLYAQAQGILHPSGHSYSGYLWYRTEIDLNAATVENGQKIHAMFPGTLDSAWLYVNGALVAYQRSALLPWASDYKFEWDVDLTNKLKPGRNTFAVRMINPSHFGGLFRRPFLYEAK